MGIALKVESFGGMLPAIDNHLLPQDSAAQASNTYLYSGKLQGMYQPTLLHTLADPNAQIAFRIPNNYTDAQHLSDATWLEFDNPDTDVLRTNVVSDTYDRYYWASSSAQPMYNTLARIKSSTNPLLLGVPAPSVAPGVSASGGVSSVTEARAYVYTWETTYGEEGPPSPPTVHTGKIDDTWAITMSAAATNDTNGTHRLIAFTNIYRTITASDGTTTYFFVAQVAIGTLSYNDTQSDTVVSANNELLSTTWTGPPTNLQGWVSMPNGMIAGWDNENNVWFCEPYRPHAWPVQYVTSVQYPIVGMGVVGQTLIITTQGFPYWAYGVNPSVMSFAMIKSSEPCLSRGSIMDAPEGVYYASPNGLVLANQGVALNITRKMVTKDKWPNLVPVPTLRASRLGTAYYAWGSARTGVFEPTAFEPTAFAQSDFTGAYAGVLVDTTDERVAITTLTNAMPAYECFNDVWTGEVFIIRNGGVYWLNIADPDPTHEAFDWWSKIFQSPNKRNLEALKIYFEVPDTTAPLNATPNSNLVQTLQPGQYGLVRLYADGKLVWTREMRTSGELMLLPSGYKADFYQLEINAYVNVFNVQVAESAKELAKV
jgi:hypothetical protein